MIKTRILTSYVEDGALQFGTFEVPDNKAAIMTGFEIIGSSESIPITRTSSNDALNLVDSAVGLLRRDVDSDESSQIPLIPLLTRYGGLGVDSNTGNVYDYYWDGNIYLPAGSSIRKIREDISIRSIIITYIEIDN